MKKISLSLLILLLLTSCMARVIMQHGKKYSIIDWEGGNFVYFTYHWKGAKFDDALAAITKFDEYRRSRKLNEQALGIYPGYREWKVGFLAKKPVDIDSVNGFKIEQMTIPPGKYASMKLKGYPDTLYLYWFKFKKWLIEDGYRVESNVMEIYTNSTFDMKIPAPSRFGELRYKVDK